MNRRLKQNETVSLNKNPPPSLSSKEALIASSSQLKQLLGHKLNKINNNPQKHLQTRLRIHPAKNITLEPIDTARDLQTVYETERLKDLDFNSGHPTRNQQRYSHKILASTQNSKSNHPTDPQEKNTKTKVETNTSIKPISLPKDSKNLCRLVGLSDNTVNSLKRRCKNFNSNGKLSTSLAMEQRKGKSGYYITDIKNSVSAFKNNEEFMDAHLTHFIQSISAFKMFTCSHLPPKPHRVVELPPLPANKITLVFDLDQTLIHSQTIDWSTDQSDLTWGNTIDIHSQEGKYQVNLKIRPHAIDVLKRLSQKFQLGVLTAGQEHYGSPLLDQLDPNGSIFSFRLYRPHCFEMNSRVSHIKDLRVLGNRDLSRVVLIDNSPHSYIFQKKNGIPIVSFFNDASDTEMLKLQQFLMSLQGVTDVQKVLHDYFKFQDYNRYSCLTRLADELY